MKASASRLLRSDLSLLILLALARLALHCLTNNQYGFHRDELAMVDDARHLAWGYVAYPPLTPFIGHVALALFGPSLVGLRFFSALAMCAGMVLAGLMARELGGTRWAQVATALAVTIAPVSLIQGALFQYVSFDYLWWVLAAYLTLRLLKSDDPRWWLGIGAVLGLGMMTKLTMGIFVAGVAGGALLTRARRYLASPWLWGGVALSLLIFAPNLIWQTQHDFISLQFLSSIHARDVAIGRTQGFLIEQLFAPANLMTIPLWLGGLYFYFFKPEGARYRMLGWMWIIPFALFVVTQGRSYYMGPAYPMLIAAGTVVWERWIAARSATRARQARGLTWGGLALGGLVMAPLMLPVAPINSKLWDVANAVHDNFAEEIGWPELVEAVADVYAGLPAEAQPRAAIFASNYGEAGAINLYGPAYGLPEAISNINSYWLRGYGDPPPETLVVVGVPPSVASQFLDNCELAGHVTNRYGVENEESRDHQDILVCRGPRQPWPELWKNIQAFG
jgi:4-amino-4-deoxy-L-arabinose transferase-like glycosyltransferase